MRSLHIIKWMHIKRYTYWTYICTCGCMGFPGHASCKNPPANAEGIRDTGSVPGWGRSPGGGLGNSLQYSCLENPRDRRAWGATVHRVAELEWLKWLSTCSVCMYLITFTITRPIQLLNYLSPKMMLLAFKMKLFAWCLVGVPQRSMIGLEAKEIWAPGIHTHKNVKHVTFSLIASSQTGSKAYLTGWLDYTLFWGEWTELYFLRYGSLFVCLLIRVVLLAMYERWNNCKRG